MENPCTLMMFGDSITKSIAPRIENIFQADYPEIQLKLLNEGVIGETSRDGLHRLDTLLAMNPDVVVIGFGMNDWRKEVGPKEYKKNLEIMVEAFDKIGTRVILSTISPSYNFADKKYNLQVDSYSDLVREIALEKRIKIADINALWKKEFFRVQSGLRDDIHPNDKGYSLICKCLMWFIPRRYTTILWQYNSREAMCNYTCPYCYYVGLHAPHDRSFGSIEEWHKAFKRSFGNQHLIFYLSFGEPMLGRMFYKIVEMIDHEPRWQLRMTTNASQDMAPLMDHKIAKEGRLHINASFHPLEVKRHDFINKLLYLRSHGIEPAVVYVAYPPFLDRMAHDIAEISKHGFVVHVRRFQGKFKGKEYPLAYSDSERRHIARYCDDGMIKYMLNQQYNTNSLTYAGLHFFIVDNVGNIGYDSNVFSPYTKYRCIFGNVHQENFKPLTLPGPYPGWREGTVDGVANLIDANYRELEGNNILSFAKQGGVYKSKDQQVVYGNMLRDFNEPRTRAIYHFQPNTLSGHLFTVMHLYHSLFKRSFVPRVNHLKSKMMNIYSRLKSDLQNTLNNR